MTRVVIQCAGSKRPAAGTFRLADGRTVAFVAAPALAPPQEDVYFAHPDDPSDQPGRSWRDRVIEANRSDEARALGFLPAGQLYTPKAYATLLQAFGPERLFILSAGWGLVGASLRLPAYDITFSGQAPAFKRRRRQQAFLDFNALAGAEPDDTVFLGGKDYLPLFLTLSSGTGERIMFHKAAETPHAPGCTTIRFNTRTSTNWHYECATMLAERGLSTMLPRKSGG